MHCAVCGYGATSSGQSKFRLHVANGCDRLAEKRIASQVRHNTLF